MLAGLPGTGLPHRQTSIAWRAADYGILRLTANLICAVFAPRRFEHQLAGAL
jgi:hypothetical protein